MERTLTVAAGATDTLDVRQLLVKEILGDSVPPGRYVFHAHVRLMDAYRLPAEGHQLYSQDTTVQVEAGSVTFDLD